MRLKNYARDIRLHFAGCDIIIYKFWPFEIRKVEYPNGEHEMAAGAFSFNRTPSEQVKAHQLYAAWKETWFRPGDAIPQPEPGISDGRGNRAFAPLPRD